MIHRPLRPQTEKQSPVTFSTLVAKRPCVPKEFVLLGGLLVFSPLLDGGTTHVAVMFIRLMILALLGSFLVRGIRGGVIRWPQLPVGSPVISYLGLALLSTLFSPYAHQSAQWLFVLLSYAAFLYLFVFFAKEWDCATKLVMVLCGIGLLEANWAITQALWLHSSRPSGTFFNPNFLAGYLAAIWVLVFGVFCYARRTRLWWIWAHNRILIHVLGVVIILGTLFVAIVLTRSRGGIAALLSGFAVVMCLQFGKKGAGIVLLVLLAGLLIQNPLRDRFYDEYLWNPVGYARWQIWQSTIHEMIEHPFGIGLGLYQYVAPRYMFPVEGEIVRYGRVAQTAHNEYLQMGAELGVVGLALFLWGVGSIVWEVRRILRLRLQRSQRGLLVGASAAAGSILLHAGLDSNLHEPAIAILLAALVGIILSISRQSGCAPVCDWIVPVRSRAMAVGLTIAVVGGLALEVTRLGSAWIVYEAGSRAIAEENDLSRGLTLYRTAITLDPGKAMYHKSLAATYFQAFLKDSRKDMVTEAIAELQTAVSLNPLDSRLYDRLGYVYASLAFSHPEPRQLLSDWKEQERSWLLASRAAYLQALELEPFSAFYRLELGRLNLALGERDAAETFVREATALEPNFLPGRMWLALYYLDTERAAAATQEYNEITERQRRYGTQTKGSMEDQFLFADTANLKLAFRKAGLQI